MQILKFLQSVPIAYLLGPKIFLSILFLNIFCSSHNVGNQAAPTYKTRGKILFFSVVIFIFWSSKWEDKKSFSNW